MKPTKPPERDEFAALSEDEKYDLVRRWMHADFRECGDFVLDVISNRREIPVIRIEALKILRDLEAIPPSSHVQTAGILNNILQQEDDLVLRQYAAMCVGLYLTEPSLLATVIEIMNHDIEVKWNIVDSISENIEVANRIQRSLELVMDEDIRSELSRLLKNEDPIQ